MTTLLISFRGEYPPTEGSGAKPAPVITPIENIIAFPDGGSSYEILQPVNQPLELRELRGCLFLNGYLYVANGYKKQHQVLRFRPAEQTGQWAYDSIYASESITHPFAVVVGFGDNVFVSSQDDNTVTEYDGSNQTGTLFASGFGNVRGLAYDGTYLYVADAGASPGQGYVAFYDSTKTQRGKVAVAEPVHLLYDPQYGWLYIGDESSGTVYIWRPTEDQGPLPLISAKDAPIDHTAGLALEFGSGTSGTLYVASRVGQQVLAFPLDFSSGMPKLNGTFSVALDNLDDEPEFVAIQGGLFG
jgi:hypothetical protein